MIPITNVSGIEDPSLIDKRIGNAYEVVEMVARHLDEIAFVVRNIDRVIDASQIQIVADQVLGLLESTGALRAAVESHDSSLNYLGPQIADLSALVLTLQETFDALTASNGQIPSLQEGLATVVTDLSDTKRDLSQVKTTANGANAGAIQASRDANTATLTANAAKNQADKALMMATNAAASALPHYPTDSPEDMVLLIASTGDHVVWSDALKVLKTTVTTLQADVSQLSSDLSQASTNIASLTTKVNAADAKAVAARGVADTAIQNAKGFASGWVGTQAEYDAIGTKADTTLYFIKKA